MKYVGRVGRKEQEGSGCECTRVHTRTRSVCPHTHMQTHKKRAKAHLFHTLFERAFNVGTSIAQQRA